MHPQLCWASKTGSATGKPKASARLGAASLALLASLHSGLTTIMWPHLYSPAPLFAHHGILTTASYQCGKMILTSGAAFR